MCEEPGWLSLVPVYAPPSAPVASLPLPSPCEGLVPRSARTPSCRRRTFPRKSWSKNLTSLSTLESSPRDVEHRGKQVRLSWLQLQTCSPHTGPWTTSPQPSVRKGRQVPGSHLEGCQSAPLTDPGEAQTEWLGTLCSLVNMRSFPVLSHFLLSPPWVTPISL